MTTVIRLLKAMSMVRSLPKNSSGMQGKIFSLTVQLAYHMVTNGSDRVWGTITPTGLVVLQTLSPIRI